MKHRVYLFITFLLVLFAFTVSEARIIDPGAGETIGLPSWSVIIPVKNTPSVSQQMARKISENQSPLPQDRGFLPKNDTNQRTKQGNTQPGKQDSIFDRWGNMKNKGSK
jgi:hypothetical protein